MLDLRDPLESDVLQGAVVVDAKAREEHVRLRVRQRPQPVVVLLQMQTLFCSVDSLSVTSGTERRANDLG